MSIESILLAVPTTLVSGRSYAVPTASVILSWQSPTGSTVEGSLNNVTWGALGTSGAGAIVTVTTAVVWIRANTNDTVVTAKPAGFFGNVIIASSINANDGHFNNWVSIGLNPAQTGALRLTNDEYIFSRSNGVLDYPDIGLNTNNQIKIGGSTTSNGIWLNMDTTMGANRLGAVGIGTTTANILNTQGRVLTIASTLVGDSSNIELYGNRTGANVALGSVHVFNSNKTLGADQRIVSISGAVGRSADVNTGSCSVRLSDATGALVTRLIMYEDGLVSMSSAGQRLEVGNNPAQANGSIRIPNTENSGIYGRNFANNGDIQLISVDVTDSVRIGNASTGIIGMNDVKPIINDTLLLGTDLLRWHQVYAIEYFDANRTVAMGKWTDHAFNAGDFTSDIGSWTVDAGDQITFAFMLIGKTLSMTVNLNNTTTAGGPIQLKITLPNGMQVGRTVKMAAGTWTDSAALSGTASLQATVNDTFVSFFRDATGVLPWPNVVNGFDLGVTFSIPII